MKLTSTDAEKLLKKFEKDSKAKGIIAHCMCVGRCAKTLADALIQKGFDIDADRVAAMGIVHDIGKLIPEKGSHVIVGYNYLKNLGYDEEYCSVCMTHSYLNGDILCTAGGIPDDIPVRTEYLKNHEYTIYDKIINLCDLLCTHEIITIDKRLIDIMVRRGVYSNTVYNIVETQKLKKMFDEMLGYDVYDLYPEIKEHLWLPAKFGGHFL